MSIKDLFKKNKADLKTMKLGNTTNPRKSADETLEGELDSAQTNSWNDAPDSFEHEVKEEDFEHLERSEVAGFQEPLSHPTNSSLELASLNDDVNYENKLQELYAQNQESLDEPVNEFERTTLNEQKTQPLNKDFDDEPEFESNFNDESFVKEKQKFSIGNFLKRKKSDSHEEDFGRRPTQSSDLDDLVGKKKDSTTGGGSISEGSFELKQKHLPIIGRLPVRKQYQTIIAAFALSAISIGVSLTISLNGNKREAQSATLATRLVGDIQRFDNLFASSTTGKQGALGDMTKLWSQIQKEKDALSLSNKDLGNEQIIALNNKVDAQLSKISKHVEAVRAEEEYLKDIQTKVTDIGEQISTLSDLVDRLGIIYIQSGATQSEMSNIFFLKSSLQTINTSLTTMFLSDTIPPELIANLTKTRKDFKQTLAELYYGVPEKSINPIDGTVQLGSYNKLINNWVKFADVIDSTLRRAPDLVAIKTLSKQNSNIINDITNQLHTMADSYNHSYSGYSLSNLLLALGLALLGVSSFALFYLYTFEKDNRSLLEKLDNSKNQGSILRLLNEMMPLQDGDLTKKTTVTEEITGAIADSINATVDSLASLVKKIKDTSLVMREKTNDVSVISIDMLRSNEQQADSIASTGSSVIEISKAINEISSKTQQGAQKAHNSVEVATSGAQQVYASIDSMQQINHNMTETVHLMRKVGDSSKQISEIVNLLSDITEETNILALNATVQAAKAGEAGKGFKIVADSIQELADNAADATRRVGALIAAVQTDIQSVGVSIEKTTQEVQKGVGLSENAGKSLQQMTQVSNELADIVSVISKDASRHAEIARQISSNMEKILQVTEENKESTKKTATSITEIAEISNELGESVQSFKVE